MKDSHFNKGPKVPASLDMRKRIKPNASHIGSLPKVTPQELDKIHRQVLDTVKHSLPSARGVLMGSLRWTNQQVKLFQIMLNKVMPDLSHSMVDVSTTKDPNKMTRAELEEIIRRGEEAEKEAMRDTVDAEYTEMPDLTPEEAAEAFNSIDPNAPIEDPLDVK